MKCCQLGFGTYQSSISLIRSKACIFGIYFREFPPRRSTRTATSTNELLSVSRRPTITRIMRRWTFVTTVTGRWAVYAQRTLCLFYNIQTNKVIKRETIFYLEYKFNNKMAKLSAAFYDCFTKSRTVSPMKHSHCD